MAHADWGSSPGKRQVAVARRARGGARIVSLGPAGGDRLFGALRDLSPSGPIVVGFDFAIGLPRAYAAAAGIGTFPEFLGQIGTPPWHEFERVAEQAAEVCLARPFYPQRPGGTSRVQLSAGLGLAACDLRRRADGRDAETLFWTLGRRQVGKAALHGWRMLRQARARGLPVELWPFECPLPVPGPGSAAFVVAETYPREFYQQAGVPRHGRWSKRRHDDRLRCAPGLLAWARSLGVTWEPGIERRVRAGFSPGPAGEDEFDAVIGVLGLIGVLTGVVAVGLPRDDPAVLSTEGWILGRPAA
jgi:hypothetical protein